MTQHAGQHSSILLATTEVTENSWNNRPITSPMNNSGKWTAISEMVSETMVKPICFDPLSAAAKGLSPISMYRLMFSITTIASSMSKPVAMVKAISERLSRLKPRRYMADSVPMRESDTDKLGMMVARRLRKNKNTTSTTSTTERQSANSISLTEARIVTVRSVSTET